MQAEASRFRAKSATVYNAVSLLPQQCLAPDLSADFYQGYQMDGCDLREQKWLVRRELGVNGLIGGGRLLIDFCVFHIEPLQHGYFWIGR